MWPVPPYKNELITITVEPQSIRLYWLQKNKNHKAPFTLQAFDQHTFDQPNIISDNPSQFAHIIHTFARAHALGHAFISCCVSGPQVHEELCNLPDQQNKQSLQSSMKYQTLALNPDSDNETCLGYICGIRPELLLQYQRMAIKHHLNVVRLTTPHMALLALYRYMYGTAFRPVQLEHHLNQRNGDITKVFSADLLARIIAVPQKFLEQYSNNHVSLMHACGLFVMEEL